MKAKILTLIVATASCLPSFAQEEWDLRKCIDYAIEHNLSIKQQEATRDQNAVELNTARWSRLPNLNGNVGQSFNFGRALQADNTYGNRNTQNTNFSLGTNVPLFTGLQIPNNIALCKLNLKAAIEDLNKAKEDISIQVTSSYLQVLFDEELAKMKELLQYVADSFPEITSLLYVINNKCNDTIGDLDVEVFSGKDHIFEEMEGLRFKVGPKSFYQTNSEQAYNLYKVAREFAGLTGNELVYDLYTGTGTIANFVSRRARQVIGIEYVPEAIEDAKVNAEINDIKNALFYAGDMKDILTEDFIREHGRPDVIITDPPRAGMHNDVINVILAAEPKRIVYVSCNPATQARDLQLLDGKYKVTAVQPVDMFPHTHHVENVVLLEKREEPKH